MALVYMLQLPDHAAEHGYGLPAFSLNNLDQRLTDPEQAADFVQRTGVDALAIANGTSHGAHEFSRKPAGDILAIDRVGAIRETYGVPVEGIREGIANGVRKVSTDTDIRLAMTGAMRRWFARHPDDFGPRKPLKEAVVAARDICIPRYGQLGSAGRASSIRPVALDAMAGCYARSELAAVVH
jgi:fructose-bisphosphate aldolase class II